jgi:transposase InsO family protein
MINPTTSWFEMVPINEKSAINIANQVEIVWLTRYPWPTQLVCDRGTEFMNEFARMVEDDYGISRRSTTVRNPRANSIIERIHQTMGNIIRTFLLHDTEDMSVKDPWQGIFAATMFALRATIHTTLQATPSQLVFGRDAILNVQYKADWTAIKA